MNPLLRISRFFSSLKEPHPSRDWLFTLIFLATLLLSLTLFASYLFFGIESGSIVTPSTVATSSAPSVTRGEIEKVLESYRARKLNYNANNFLVIPLQDPSGNFGLPVK